MERDMWTISDRAEANDGIWSMALIAFSCIVGVFVTVSILFQLIGLS